LQDAEAIANIALFYSHETMHQLTPQCHEEVLEHFQGAYQALLEHHIPFDIVCERQALADELQRYDVCVLPNAINMSDEAIAAIHSYVDNGGNLVSTYQTATKDQDGIGRDHPGLIELTGVEVLAAFHADGPRGIARFGGQNPALYCRVKGGHAISQGLEGRLFSFSGSTLLVRLEEGVEAPAVVLDYDSEILARDGFFTWYPGEEASPMITARELGSNNRVVYIAADLTRAYWLYGWPELAQLFTQSVLWAAQSEPPFKVTSPHPLVEVRGYRRPVDDAIVLIFSNLATNQTLTVRGGGFPLDRANMVRSHSATIIVPQFDLHIRLRSDLHEGRTLRSLIGSEVSTESHGHWLEIQIPKLDAYEALILE
jgi:hypothetical protein